MNATQLPMVSMLAALQVPPELNRQGHEVIRAAVFSLIPAELFYFSIYFHMKGVYRLYRMLTAFALAAFWIAPYAAPISCGPVKCLQNFAIAIGTMKLLDIWARRHSLPEHSSGKTPPDWLLAFKVMTELRWESFYPNNIRMSKDQENFNEPLQLAIHVLVFVGLQALPQQYPTILAWEVLLSIYVIWTSMQMILRYKSSPALFGPLYLADSLTGFWSETWHNAFAAPCQSLAYSPIRNTLPKYGVPLPIARSLGVIGAFGLMGIFHIYALSPLLPSDALNKIGLFFFFNGIATVAEAMIWGHKKHWARAALAWIFETVVSTWTVNGIYIPNGLSSIPWTEVCKVRY